MRDCLVYPIRGRIELAALLRDEARLEVSGGRPWLHRGRVEGGFLGGSEVAVADVALALIDLNMGEQRNRALLNRLLRLTGSLCAQLATPSF